MASTNTPSQSTPNPPTPALPEGLTPDSIDLLPVLSALLGRLQDLAPDNSADAIGGIVEERLARKDFVPATDELRHKLQRARAMVRELPDVERSLSEQEAEIRELEGRIRRQKETLRGLREVGVKATREKGIEAGVMETVG